jgi:hypothetical protein
MDNKTLDQILYEAYGESIRETFRINRGASIPYGELHQDIIDAWKAAADAAIKWYEDQPHMKEGEGV